MGANPWADRGVTGLVGWETRSDELARWLTPVFLGSRR